MGRIINAIKQFKMRDLLAPFVFLLLLVPSSAFRVVNKLRKRNLWLIAEEGEARDNGYYFYKYVREKHPSDYCFYAMTFDSAGYDKVAKLGNVIKWGGLKHWLFYMSANLNISSQKSGNPAPIFWYILHVKLGLYKDRVFLQHGITKDDSKWIYYNQTRFKYFVCGAKREYDYILGKFGYKKDSLLLTGFPRWDSLKDASRKQKQKSILIMPTWRNWLGGDKNKMFKNRNFLSTDYYKSWSGFLKNQDFIKYIEENNIRVYFYPHINMRSFLKFFNSPSRNIKILSPDDNIQRFFSKCNLMVTDYSSVAFDFAFLNKPVIYYQFDLKEYRARQHQEGYFDYKKDGFGPVVDNMDDILRSIKKLINATKTVDYGMRAKIFFTLHDARNCERLYNAIANNNNHIPETQKKKKIMYVSNKMNYGGIETFLMNVVRILANKQKYAIVFLTFKDFKFDYEDEIIKLGCRILRIPTTRNPIKRYMDLNKIMKMEKPDIVHGNVAFENALVMKAANKNAARVRISHSHTTCPDRFGRKMYHKFLANMMQRNATNLIACEKEAGENLFRGYNFEVIYNGVEIDQYLFDEEIRLKYRKKFGYSDDDIIIGHVGRLSKEKNQEHLLRILKELDSSKYKMVIVGDGDLNGHLKKVARELGVVERVLFLGNRNDVCYLYNMFDIFVFPSLYEGLSMALIEAQANGLPVVASSTISPNTKINRNFVFEDITEDSKKWRDDIYKAKKSRVVPALRIQDYSINRIVERLEKIYERGGK